MGMSIGPREPALHAGRRPRLDGESGPVLRIYRLVAGQTCVAADRASAETESEPKLCIYRHVTGQNCVAASCASAETASRDGETAHLPSRDGRNNRADIALPPTAPRPKLRLVT
jgi:hypothetical protein